MGQQQPEIAVAPVPAPAVTGIEATATRYSAWHIPEAEELSLEAESKTAAAAPTVSYAEDGTLLVYPWVEVFTEEGESYYYNEESEETRWYPPGVDSPAGGECSESSATSSESDADQEGMDDSDERDRFAPTMGSPGESTGTTLRMEEGASAVVESDAGADECGASIAGDADTVSDDIREAARVPDDGACDENTSEPTGEGGGETAAITGVAHSLAATTTTTPSLSVPVGGIDANDECEMENFSEDEEYDDYENQDLEWTPDATMISKHINFEEIQFCGTLGHGAFSSVKLVRVPGATQPAGRSRTGLVVGDHEYFAMKVMARSYIVDNGWEELVSSERAAMVEIENFGMDVLAEPRRRFTLGLHHAFVDEFCVYLMVDLCTGGELYDFCKSQEHGYVTSTEARFFAACIALALQEVHGCDMIYRDLKLENLIIDAHGYLIMADFGLAKKTTRTYTVCGTPEYMAPEVILSTGHDRAIDLWALGISIFEILCGATPFAGGSPMETYENIVQFEDFSRSNKGSFNAGVRAKRANSAEEDSLPWNICNNVIDTDTRDVVRRLLLKGKCLRLGARSKSLDSLIRHQFFDSIDWAALVAQELDESEIPHCPPVMDTSGFEGKAVPLKVHVATTVGGEGGHFTDRSGWLPDGFKRVE